MRILIHTEQIMLSKFLAIEQKKTEENYSMSMSEKNDKHESHIIQ